MDDKDKHDDRLELIDVKPPQDYFDEHATQCHVLSDSGWEIKNAKIHELNEAHAPHHDENDECATIIHDMIQAPIYRVDSWMYRFCQWSAMTFSTNVTHKKLERFIDSNTYVQNFVNELFFYRTLSGRLTVPLHDGLNVNNKRSQHLNVVHAEDTRV